MGFFGKIKKKTKQTLEEYKKQKQLERRIYKEEKKKARLYELKLKARRDAARDVRRGGIGIGPIGIGFGTPPKSKRGSAGIGFGPPGSNLFGGPPRRRKRKKKKRKSKRTKKSGQTIIIKV